VPFSAAATAVSVSQYFVNPNYTGEVIDQNDIAVLRLAQKAPDWAASYNIAFGGDLTGKQYNVAGFGARSDVGGAVGADLGTGRRRQGDNTYAFRLGDPDFGGAWPSILQGPLIPLLLGIAVLYFFVFRAKRSQDKQRTDLLQKLKPGQKVQTIGGILGTITQVNDKEVTVKVDETNNVKIKFTRNAIHRVQDDDSSAA